MEKEEFIKKVCKYLKNFKIGEEEIDEEKELKSLFDKYAEKIKESDKDIEYCSGPGRLPPALIFDGCNSPDGVFIHNDKKIYIELKHADTYSDGHRWATLRDSISQSLAYTISGNDAITLTWEDKPKKILENEEDEKNIIQNAWNWLGLRYIKKNNNGIIIETKCDSNLNGKNKGDNSPEGIKKIIKQIQRQDFLNSLRKSLLKETSPNKKLNRKFLSEITTKINNMQFTKGFGLEIICGRNPSSGEYAHYQIDNNGNSLSLGVIFAEDKYKSGLRNGVLASNLLYSLSGENRWSISIVLCKENLEYNLPDERKTQVQEFINKIWKNTGSYWIKGPFKDNKYLYPNFMKE
jgi:hypothetical protein